MMFSKKEMIKEEKDCAVMLGMSIKEYHDYVKNTKVPTKKDKKNNKYDNTILCKLGLTSNDLKRRKVY